MTAAQVRSATSSLANTPAVFVTRDGVAHEIGSSHVDYEACDGIEGMKVDRRPLRLVFRESRQIQGDPIPRLTDDELAPLRSRPGEEMLVTEMLTNSRAYHVCRDLIRRGYAARKQKLAEDRHAVYATWTVEDAAGVNAAGGA